jgi:hypothetical protein
MIATAAPTTAIAKANKKYVLAITNDTVSQLAAVLAVYALSDGEGTNMPLWMQRFELMQPEPGNEMLKEKIVKALSLSKV